MEDGPKLRVHQKPTIRIAALVLAAVLTAAFAIASAAPAFAALPPHIPNGDSTDSCAMCHRVHSADTDMPYRAAGTTETTGNALIFAPDPSRGDVTLCLSCHGVGQLGSNTDVESSFAMSSVHGLVPTSTAYGPSPLYCSTCHDSHGTDRAADGDPYPALLRSYEGTAAVFSGDAYCATCHTIRDDERWDGLSVFESTAHYTALPMPASGTQIHCSICHDAHGSNVAPLLVGSLVPTSVVSTFTVTADDRTFCIACHTDASATWPGGTVYARSAHARSDKKVPISARWVTPGQREVGECQVCHDPMGKSNGSGGAIPKLLDASGRTLCDRCHAPDGVASTDTSSQARPVSGAPELAVTYSPAVETTADGIVLLYGRASAGPGRLSGPREYGVPSGVGPSAIGNIDGVGSPELVVASPGSPVLTVLRTDPLTGLSSTPTTYAIPAGSPAVALAIANVIHNGPGDLDDPEIAVVTAAGQFALYDWSGSVLETMDGPFPVGAGPWALTTGDVTGTALPDAIVTSAASGTVSVFFDNGSNGATSTVWDVGGAPVAPAVGRLWNGAPSGADQLVVCDASSPSSDTVRIIDGSGVVLATCVFTPDLGVPTASAIGDLLWSVPAAGRADLALAFTAASGDSSVVVLPQRATGSGLDTTSAIVFSTGRRSRTDALLVGDVDGGGRTDLVVGDGGTWARDASAQAPDVRVFRPNAAGDSLDSTETHVGGGVELAGGVPSLALAELGPVFPSRHPIDEAAAAHVSTETAPFARHVTCTDCHDPHVAEASAGTFAPHIQDPIEGAWGVTVAYSAAGTPSFGAPGPADTSFGVCFKCHSSYVALDGRPDLAREFDPANASVHAVERAATSTVPAATFVDGSGFTAASVLYCTDCHGDHGRTGDEARGVHESDAAPILAKPYLGTASTDPDALCYSCHRFDVYANGSADTTGMSGFAVPASNERLHGIHVNVPGSGGGHGLGCDSCHVSHGSTTLPHLLRGDIGFVSTGSDSGSCTNGCHDPAVTGGTRAYGS